MKNQTVLIVGVGALGSHLVQFLRNEDVLLRVIDFDRVEQKNTMSQFYGRPSIGKNKTTGLQQTMDFLFKLKLEVVPHKLTQDNAKQLLARADFVIDCLDNVEARTLVQTIVRSHDTPCLHGALAPDGQYGRVVWDESFVIDSEAGVGGATCENGEHLPFITLVASYMARATQAFLATGAKSGYEINPAGAFRT